MNSIEARGSGKAVHGVSLKGVSSAIVTVYVPAESDAGGVHIKVTDLGIASGLLRGFSASSVIVIPAPPCFSRKVIESDDVAV